MKSVVRTITLHMWVVDQIGVPTLCMAKGELNQLSKLASLSQDPNMAWKNYIHTLICILKYVGNMLPDSVRVFVTKPHLATIYEYR